MDGARLRFILLALVAGTLAVVIWTLFGGSERPGAAFRAATDLPQHASHPTAGAPDSAPALPDVAVQSLLPEPAAADSELRLLVLREGDEVPLAGVSAHVATAGGGNERAATDGSGRLRLAVPTGPVEVEIAATASTRIGRARFEEAGDQRIVVPRRGGEVTGRVVELDGDPVQGADVLLWKASPDDAVDWVHPVCATLTDAGGAFALQDTAGDEGDAETFLIAARKSDHASLFALASRTSKFESVHGARLVLGDAPPLSGRVRSSAGEPVRAILLAQADCGAYLAWCAAQSAPLPDGAWLQRDAGCTVQPLRIQLLTDADGRFLLPGLADRWTFFVRTDGFPSAHAARDAAVDSSLIEIVLPAPVTLYGTVRDVTGGPVRGARVTIRTPDGQGAVEADDSGSWRFDDLSPAIAQLTASSPGLATWCEDLELADVSAGPHDIVLQPGLALAGSALDVQGKPLLAALVQITSESSAGAWPIRPGFLLPSGRDWTSTGNGGAFRFDNLAAGRYRVELVARAYGEALAAVMANAGDTHVRLVQGEGLDLVARVSGRVIDAAGQARADVLIHVQAYADADTRLLTLEADTYADETARFTLPEMQSGWVRLAVWPLPDMRMPAAAWERSRGEPLLTWGPLLVTGGTQELELRLPR